MEIHIFHGVIRLRQNMNHRPFVCKNEIQCRGITTQTLFRLVESCLEGKILKYENWFLYPPVPGFEAV